MQIEIEDIMEFLNKIGQLEEFYKNDVDIPYISEQLMSNSYFLSGHDKEINITIHVKSDINKFGLIIKKV